jgi:hypothetical protein
MGIHFVSDEMVEMRYQYKEEFVEESGRTNVVIAAYTTAQALLKLSTGDKLYYTVVGHFIGEIS